MTAERREGGFTLKQFLDGVWSDFSKIAEFLNTDPWMVILLTMVVVGLCVLLFFDKGVEKRERILFYGGLNYYLSNFSSFQVEWKGYLWPTAEHAYQAEKFQDLVIRKRIRTARSAFDAKRIAFRHEGEVRADWDVCKIEVMCSILTAKLAQHPWIQKKLEQTGNAELVEDSPTDSFWGRGPDWKGQNMLGKIWMDLRAGLVLKKG